jgi:hypothetical protein
MTAQTPRAFLVVDLQYPNKVLWPNGRTQNPAYKRLLQKTHKTWAFNAAGAGIKKLDQCQANVCIRVSPKLKGPPPDQDNIIAACKYYLDGISLATNLNDRFFNAPTVEFIERSQYGRIFIEVTQ